MVSLKSSHQHTKDQRIEGLQTLGSAALFLGAVIFLLAGLEAIGGLPIRMPRSWYTDRVVWFGGAVFSMAMGGYLLYARREITEDWMPSQPGVRFRSVTFYTREGCHLCDDARSVLLKYAAYLPQIQEIDVDGRPDTAKQFGHCVPVIELDGKVRFRGRVNEILLRRLIEGASPREVPPRSVA